MYKEEFFCSNSIYGNGSQKTKIIGVKVLNGKNPVQSTLDLVKFLGSRVYFTKSKNFTISNTAKMDNFQNLVENYPFYDLNCTRKLIILISSRF